MKSACSLFMWQRCHDGVFVCFIFKNHSTHLKRGSLFFLHMGLYYINSCNNCIDFLKYRTTCYINQMSIIIKFCCLYSQRQLQSQNKAVYFHAIARMVNGLKNVNTFYLSGCQQLQTCRIPSNTDRCRYVPCFALYQGTIGCTPNSVPMVFIVFSRDSWGLYTINTHYIGLI